jgi:hypothetical protein
MQPLSRRLSSALLLAIAGAWHLLSPQAALRAEVIQATHVDGKEFTLNQAGRVTVVLYSCPAVQDRTREAGKAVYEFQGRDDFRVAVVVDLRGSLAPLAKGYTARRMKADLDEEAKRVKPFYLKNGNTSDPRPNFAAFADFDGALSKRLGWKEPQNQMRVVIFDRNGNEAGRWADLGAGEYGELAETVRRLLP